MLERVKDPVLLWVEGTSKEGVYVKGFLNKIPPYRYFGIDPGFADVMERQEARSLIEKLTLTEPRLIFFIKGIE